MLRLRVLGSGDAFNSAGALHSSYLLESDTGTLLLECGPSVLAGMKRAGLDTTLPDAVLVSHLHGDHFGGIPFLLLEYKFKNPRRRPLVIAGPSTTEQRIDGLSQMLYPDVREGLGFELEHLAFQPGSRNRLAGFDVEAFEVPHSAEPFCLGYRISGGGGAVLFSGDSAWTDEFVRKSAGVDLFLCECCSIDPDAPIHTSYRDITAHRRELGCKRLVLTHLGADVRASTRVEVERAHDGMVIELAD